MFQEFFNLIVDERKIEIDRKSPLVLAYIGDAVFELLVRTYVIKDDFTLDKLNRESTKLVSANGQKEIYFILEDELDDEEKIIFKRGRNSKVKTKSKNASMHAYITSTGLEALFGYLFLKKNFDRILYLFNLAVTQENDNE